MLLMTKKDVRGGISHAIHRYVKGKNKYMKDYDKNNESSYFQYLDVKNVQGCAVSQKLLSGGFECVKKISQFNEYFIKSDNKDSDEVYFFYFYDQYPKQLH